jgi:hypothetical protein
VWTRREARTDWKARYKSVRRRDDLNVPDAADADYEKARSEGYRTPKEIQEERWAAEAESEPSKEESRAYYKVGG